MKHGSLFSGIGGFDLASEWMGWENVFQVEIDDYCQKVLAKNFPNVKRYGDIKEFKGECGSVDILTGGFPCQPFSHAGKRKGESDDRYLWPEYLRIIREIQPTYVVGENVAGLVSMEDGKTLNGIFTDLEGEGYTVESFIIPACGVGAWHRRDRIWIVAYSNNLRGGAELGKVQKEDGEISKRNNNAKSRNTGKPDSTESEGGCSPKRISKEYGAKTVKRNVPDTNDTGDRSRGSGDDGSGKKEIERRKEQSQSESCGYSEDVPNGSVKGLQRSKETQYNESNGAQPRDKQPSRCDRGGEYWAAEPGVGNLVDGIPSWVAEPNIPRVSKGVKDRVNKLKGLGNAIVPKVAYEIFRAIDNLD